MRPEPRGEGWREGLVGNLESRSIVALADLARLEETAAQGALKGHLEHLRKDRRSKTAGL
jgi:hypothetical protein